MMSVNTLAEAPDADGYIIELGMNDYDHPAASLDDEEIRKRIGPGEWYVRPGAPAEEVELILQIDEKIDHSRLPAYLILGTHPQDATDAVVIYLDEVETVEQAWQVLEEAIHTLGEVSAKDGTPDMSMFAEHLNRKNVWTAMKAGGLAVQYINFAGLL